MAGSLETPHPQRTLPAVCIPPGGVGRIFPLPEMGEGIIIFETCGGGSGGGGGRGEGGGGGCGVRRGNSL